MGECRAAGQGLCRQLLTPCSASLFLSRELGNGGQGANGTEAKGSVAFLLQTNSIRNTFMETRFIAPAQPGRTKGHTGLAATLQVRGLHPGPQQFSRQKQGKNAK